MTEFNRSFSSSTFVPLTDVNGTALETVSDSPGFFKLAGNNASVLDFYLDYNGTKYMRVDEINVTASKEVAYMSQYGWIVAGTFKEKPPYRGMVSESASDDELPTAYSSGEYVPAGTKHLVRVTITDTDVGEYEIYVNVMASGY